MTSKTTTPDATEFFASFTRGFEDLQARFGFQAGGRDLALKGLAATREQVGTARKAFAETAGQAQAMAGETGTVFARAARDVAEAGFAGTDLALDAFEKMLTAASPADAFKAQADYVRTATTTAADTLRKMAETAGTAVSTGAEQVRGEFEKLGRKAA